MPAPLVVIGGGRMGEALVAGLLAQADGVPQRTAAPASIVVVETSAERRAQLSAADGLAGRFPAVTVASEPPAGCQVILAVKPDVVQAACEQLAAVGVTRVLCVAAGVTLARLETWLGHPVPVVRAMPNTPALVGAGASAIAGGTHAGPDDLAWAEAILGSVGTVVRVAEGLLDGVTGLSGSGPAYVFLLAEAMIDAGVLVGLPRSTAYALTVQTVLGAARMLAESGQSPEVLRAGVTSPGGTTAAGLRALETASLRSAVLDAVSAAAERAGELGRS
ncbi:MAG: pyrroline-5-carboxylate reductase [Actinomycetota bacterium]|nr:pyrroline-5-carboxylate reductase [Actinomycetota bacterium]